MEKYKFLISHIVYFKDEIYKINKQLRETTAYCGPRPVNQQLTLSPRVRVNEASIRVTFAQHGRNNRHRTPTTQNLMEVRLIPLS